MLNLSEEQQAIQQEWLQKGEIYAKAVNKMVAWGELNGWEKWKGEEPVDEREPLAAEVVQLLRKANDEGKVEAFRALFPPAHPPFAALLEEKGQSIESLCFIEDDTIALVVGAPYEQRQAYVLNGTTAEKLSPGINCIGKSPRNQVFAIADNQTVSTYRGWGGNKIAEFRLPEVDVQGLDYIPITRLIPFNDGRTVLLVSSEGIYLLSDGGHTMIHPLPDPEEEEWISNIAMEHAALSPDNSLIALGDQCSEHRILNVAGAEIAEIGPQSSYPHYALFSTEGEQVVLNSCHFYNGVSIGLPTSTIEGLKIEAYSDGDRFTLIDEDCRVYTAVATVDYYIFGDAYGYIKAYSKDGQNVWRYFLGSTIMGMTISDDEQTLWVSSFAGIVHKLKLDAGQRDNHTIGTGQHYEDVRVMFWKDEPKPLIW